MIPYLSTVGEHSNEGKRGGITKTSEKARGLELHLHLKPQHVVGVIKYTFFYLLRILNLTCVMKCVTRSL